MNHLPLCHGFHLCLKRFQAWNDPTTITVRPEIQSNGSWVQQTKDLTMSMT